MNNADEWYQEQVARAKTELYRLLGEADDHMLNCPKCYVYDDYGEGPVWEQCREWRLDHHKIMFGPHRPDPWYLAARRVVDESLYEAWRAVMDEAKTKEQLQEGLKRLDEFQKTNPFNPFDPLQSPVKP